MTMVNRLKDSAKDQWQQLIHHPFVAGIGEGTVSHRQFGYFLTQDALYLGDFLSTLAVAASRAPRREWTETLLRHAENVTTVETALHASLLPAFGVSAADLGRAVPGLATIAYTDHLVRTAWSRTWPATMAAVLPCYLSYQEIGIHLMKQQGKLDAINFVVMTDYSVHSQWIHPAVDMYFVGSEDMRNELLDRKVPDSKIMVSGIPVDERFQEEVDIERVKASLNVDATLPILLFMGGAYMPIGEYVQVLKILDQVRVPHTTIVIAGHEAVRMNLAKQYLPQAANPMVVLGYVNNVHELMAISSLLISKAGGLTTTESLCRGLPTIIYRPIPGQEDANAEFLVRNGAGRRAHSEEDLGEIVTHLLEHPWELKSMAHQARALGHADAAQIVAQQIYLALQNEEAHAPA
ncbi:MGDG synthase family glycosyltransferase [Sulfobacillus thermotolerans]|uniref:MGDG synthase family glycosyltransferase n=1 Tax=Sulfobacillus thermotolerans TaxID=338644 RepID=UPI0033686261